MFTAPTITETSPIPVGRPPEPPAFNCLRLHFVVERKEVESDGQNGVRHVIHLRPVEPRYQWTTEAGTLRRDRLPGENDAAWGHRVPMGKLVLTGVRPAVADYYAVNQTVLLDLSPGRDLEG